MNAIDWRSWRTRTLAIAYVASGFVALGCETLWFRSLALLFGSTVTAAGMLLAVFMIGLALGAELGARIADRARHPARGYALAECIVALSAFASPRAFVHVRDLALAHSFLTRAALSASLLALPTIAMGATLPLLTAALVTRRAALRAGLGTLYALNLVGASLGAAITTVLLLPRFGVTVSTRVLASIAGVVAMAAWFAATPMPSRAPPADASKGDRLAVVLAALVGTLTFALQVTWNRVFATLLGSSAYTFGIVASVILVANAFGGFVSARGDDRGPAAIARRLLVFAITVHLGTLVVLVAPAPLAFVAAQRGSIVKIHVLVVALVVGIPSFVAGDLFARLAHRFPTRGAGRTAGRAQLVVTLGNVAGALLASLVLVPRMGAQSTLALVAFVALVGAVLAAIPAGLDAARGTALAAVLAVGFAYFVHPAWDPASLSAGTFRVASYRALHERSDAPCGPDRRFGRHRVLFAREGALATVVVLGHPSDAHCSLYSLRINGKAEGSVFVDAPLADRVPTDARVFATGDLPTEVLAGWLPGVLAPRHAQTLLVGWGTGISTRALLATDPAHVTAVEIEPAVLDAADHFDPAPRRDPRVTLVIDDARTVLARWPLASLDVIVSHPSNPWVAGAAALFSTQYFATARARLRPGGRMLAWIQLYDSDRDVVRGQLATFAQVFPETFVVQPSSDARDLLLVGVVPPGPRDTPALLAAIVTRDDASPGVTSLQLAGRVLAGPVDVARITRGARRYDEDDAWVEYRVADHLLRGDGEASEAIVAALFARR